MREAVFDKKKRNASIVLILAFQYGAPEHSIIEPFAAVGIETHGVGLGCGKDNGTRIYGQRISAVYV